MAPRPSDSPPQGAAAADQTPSPAGAVFALLLVSSVSCSHAQRGDNFTCHYVKELRSMMTHLTTVINKSLLAYTEAQVLPQNHSIITPMQALPGIPTASHSNARKSHDGGSGLSPGGMLCCLYRTMRAFRPLLRVVVDDLESPSGSEVRKHLAGTQAGLNDHVELLQAISNHLQEKSSAEVEEVEERGAAARGRDCPCAKADAAAARDRSSFYDVDDYHKKARGLEVLLQLRTWLMRSQRQLPLALKLMHCRKARVAHGR